ncbi:MAG: hypothetical protein O7E52_18040 [Candidatus Poribacteria bacterium]|nr:hypothetical protein [Candidatus Poribacteria bacterium]
MEWASFFWKIGFGFMLFALSVFCGYLWAMVDSISDILRSVKGLASTLIRNLLTGFDTKEIEALLGNINQTLQTLNSELPRLLENMNGIAVSMQGLSSRMRASDHNDPEMTVPCESKCEEKQ